MHDWDDRNASIILNSISQAMNQNLIFILVEGILDKSHENQKYPEYIQTRNIEQRIWTEGKVRRLKDHEKLIRKANLEISTITDTKVFDVLLIYCKRK